MSWIPYKDHIEKRRHKAFMAGAAFGIQIDPQFTVMAVKLDSDQDYYDMVISEFREYVGLEELDSFLAELGLDEFDD